MDRFESPFIQAQPPKKPKSGMSTTELVIWSTAVLVASLIMFGVIAAIPFAPRLASILNPSQTPTRTSTRLPAVIPIQTVASAAPTEMPATSSPEPTSTRTPAPSPTQVIQTSFSNTSTPSLSANTNTQQPATPRISTTSPVASLTPSKPLAPTLTRTPSATRTASFTPPPTATRTPTSTRPPDFTPTFTATVPTTPPEGWSFVSVRLHPDTFSNSLLVFGEAVNNTGDTQEIISITGTFNDGQGQVIAGPDTTSDFRPVDIVPDGGHVPFELTVVGITEAATYTLEVQSRPNSDTPRQDFEFSVQSQYTEFDEYCLRATVQNTGPELTEYLTIAAVLFDSEGNLINLSAAYEPQLEEVADGLPHEFDICVDPLDQTVDR